MGIRNINQRPMYYCLAAGEEPEEDAGAAAEE